MRIGLPMKCLDSARGGLEMYFTRLSQWLSANGHEVHFFSEHIREQPAGVRIHHVRPFVPAVLQAATRAERLDVLVGSDKVVGMNVFQAHGGTVRGNIGQVLAQYRNPLLRRTLTALNELNPKYLAAIRLERQQYTQQRPRPQYVAVSQKIRDEIRRFYQVAEDRLSVVYNGVDTERFSPQRCAGLREKVRREWGLEPRTVCFLLVAHDFYLKGVRALVRATAQLRRQASHFKVVVAGRGNPSPFLRQARRLGCAEWLHFPGPYRDIGHAYGAADVYVHPSWYDAFSLAVLEAWACGLPVITTRCTGASELLVPGENGHVIDSPADTESLGQRMTELLHGDSRREMGAKGRALAEQHHEDARFREILAIFERAAAENPAGRLLNAA